MKAKRKKLSVEQVLDAINSLSCRGVHAASCRRHQAKTGKAKLERAILETTSLGELIK